MEQASALSPLSSFYRMSCCYCIYILYVSVCMTYVITHQCSSLVRPSYVLSSTLMQPSEGIFASLKHAKGLRYSSKIPENSVPCPVGRTKQIIMLIYGRVRERGMYTTSHLECPGPQCEVPHAYRKYFVRFTQN